MAAVGKTIFERLDRGRPPPVKKAQEVSPAQRLLNFLQRWPKDIISVREITQFGPRVKLPRFRGHPIF
jgi:hypothetical protein